MSTASRLVVPSTSRSPAISKLPLALRKVAFSAGWVQKTVLAPVPQFTALSLLLDCRIVVLAKVVPEEV